MGRPRAAIDPSHLRTLANQFSDEEIGRRLGHARVTVTSARKLWGIPSFTEATGRKRRDGSDSHGGRRRTILFDERFFSEISDEATAYFLGLLAADGCVSSCCTKVEIQLAEPDDYILYEFVHRLNGRGCRIAPRRRADRSKTFYRLTLCSKSMAQDLIDHGLTPRKTAEMRLLRPIPKSLQRHFLRGLWDGDGSIGAKHFEIGIQSHAFAIQVADMIGEIGQSRPNLRSVKTAGGGPFFALSVSSMKYHAFRQELYRDSSLYLPRKKDRFITHWC